MDISRRARPFTIYPKIVLTFLIVVIPLYVISLVLNQSAAHNMRNEITNSMQTNIHFYLSTFESEVNRIAALKLGYLFDDDFQKISSMAHFMPVYERTNTILRIQKKLELMKNSSLYVDEASAIVPLIGKTLHTDHYDDQPVPEDKMRALSKIAKSPLIYWDNRLYLSSAYPESNYGNLLPVFLITVKLSTPQLERTLGQITGIKGGGAVLAGNDGSWMLNAEADSELLGALSGEMANLPFNADGRGQATMKNNGTTYLLTYEKSAALNATVLIYYPKAHFFTPLNKYKVWMWLLSLFSFSIIIGFSYWIYRIIHRPLQQLVSAFRQVEKGDLGVHVQYRYRDEFRYLYNQFNAMVARLNVLIHQVYEQQIRNQRAELKQLQSQINPHFLYNSFYALYRMAKVDDTENVVTITQHLGKYFHFLARTGKDEVPLEAEMEHAKSYVVIQMARFKEQIAVHWDDIPDIGKAVEVPRMILQPLIENAYQHGLEDLKEGARLLIGIEALADCLTITIEDNGAKLTDQKLQELKGLMKARDVSETTGLINVHRRLQLWFGERWGLHVARGQLGGMFIELKIPYRKEE